jgi:hypothetical protein
VNEWIARIMPLPVRDPGFDSDSAIRELARFRLRIIAPHERPGSRIVGPHHGSVDIGPVRVLALDTANPHGGVGGSLDSDQCAWLVRELGRSRDRYVVLATHDGARTMTNATAAPGAPPRVLGTEVVSLLLAQPTVIAWVSDTMHDRTGRRHGDAAHGFWELPGATSGVGSPLAGGLCIRAEDRHLHRVVVLAGALAGDAGPHWELRDPLPEVSAAARPAPAAAPR